MNDANARMTALRSCVGDVVEIRSEQEILATLDEKGELDGLPFMPEMLQYCGKRVRVQARADKTCDTIDYTGTRRLFDTVHLSGLRCDGGAHGGCQARCLLFWREAWLKWPESAAAAPVSIDRSRVVNATRRPGQADDGSPLYRCQATELPRASLAMPWWDVRQYLRDVWSGNVSFMALIRAALFRIFLKTQKIAAYRAQIWIYNQIQRWRHGTPFPYVHGTLDKTPKVLLDLKPGELVQVKSQHEILQTVNNRNRNRGLSFDHEMVPYCGRVMRVLDRVERTIDERTGKMIHLSTDCIILEGAVCRGEYSDSRLFCPRALYPFWREIWLKRVEAPDAQSGKTPP